MPLRRSTSCEFTSFSHGTEYNSEGEKIKGRRSRSARKKSVQWSEDLEEVRYFSPHRSRSETIRRKFQKVKKRAEHFTEQPLMRVFMNFRESRVKRLRLIGQHTNCFSLDSGMQSFEEYNKQWDRLFEMYSSPNISVETKDTETVWQWILRVVLPGQKFGEIEVWSYLGIIHHGESVSEGDNEAKYQSQTFRCFKSWLSKNILTCFVQIMADYLRFRLKTE